MSATSLSPQDFRTIFSVFAPKKYNHSDIELQYPSAYGVGVRSHEATGTHYYGNNKCVRDVTAVKGLAKKPLTMYDIFAGDDIVWYGPGRNAGCHR